MTIWTAVTFGVAAISAAATVADQGQLFNGIALPLPTRELEWKDVNILSLSDTHGWLLGHQHATWPEPNYSGDYGNFASFVTHMRAIADAKGVDLLLVDAGDHHDGSGLVSSSAESASKADEIFSMLPYDIIAIGNHELYSYASAKEIYDHCERWGGRYVTSNVNITVEEDGQAVSKPIGERYVKFETKQRVYLNTQMSIAIGRKVTAFGIIFNCGSYHIPSLLYVAGKLTKSPSPSTRSSTSALAHEPWFLETIKDAPDYFVLVGHMPARGETSEWAPVFEAIRRVHPYVPVYVFGGHTHVRDCTQYDSHSIAVVPGRYMETVAFTSSSLPVEEHPEEPLSVARRYIDGNPLSYRFHTKTSPDDFNLPIGRNITLELLRLSSELNISRPLGVAPKDLFLARYKYGHPNSVLTEWVKHVLPSTIIDRKRSAVNRTIIVQSGSLRFDVFQGRFDRNDELTLSPFYNHFYYTTLPYRTGKNVLEQLNRAGASKLVPNAPSTKREEEERVDRLYNQWLSSQQPSPELGGEGLFGSSDQIAWNSGSTKKGLTLGYVTEDACPGIGDDIEHIPLPHDLDQPDFLGTVLPADLDDDDEMDVVIMDFSLDDFLVAVKVLDPKSDLKASDMRVYADGVQLNEIWGQYAKTAWQ